MTCLRALEPRDADAIYVLLSDDRVIRYMLFPRFDHARARTFVERYPTAAPTGSPQQVVFGIAAEGESALAGLCGLVLDAGSRQGELWYLLQPALWGRGIVTDAARALVTHGFSSLGLHRIWASCLPENPGSARVLEKLGFRHEGSHRQNLLIRDVWRDSHTYAVLSREWRDTPADP